MRKHHPKNERMKRQYLAYLEEARRMSPKSTDQTAAAIARFEVSTGYRDFALFHIEQARRFKRQLSEQINPKTGKPLAKATVHSQLMALKAFVHWLAGQPGYKTRISYSDAEYFNPSANDTRIATARRETPAATIDQIRHTLGRMPTDTDIARRNRALIAFALLSGVRDDALASLSLKHVDLARRQVFQDARTVRTKNRKTITSWFFPVGEDIEKIIAEWIGYLQTELHYGPDDPLFPATRVALDAAMQFAPAGLERRHWKNADAIRRIFREAFAAAGLPSFNPHSFRRTLALLGERLCMTPEAFKAWSQNLGHEHVLTTFTSYGEVSSHRQAEILQELRGWDGDSGSDDRDLDPATVHRVLDLLKKQAARR